MLHKCGFYVGKTRQDIGAWGVWRESHRFEARDKHAKELPDSRFRNWIYKWKELIACVFGRGSVLVFYARPILSESHK
jgi:hypothetical protein